MNSFEKLDDYLVTIDKLNDYFVALEKEKQYTKSHGSKKYRVEKGQYVTCVEWRDDNEYVYNFEMDTELFLPEDALMYLDLDGERFYGRVLMCENFQITVGLQYHIGDHISKAFIILDSWRLIESLQVKLEKGLYSNPAIANQIVKGIELSDNTESIDNIGFGQEKAKEMVLNNSVTFVWGPPGTGKTHTMAEMAIDLIDKGKKVLIVSHSNVSVDGIALKIGEILRQRNREHDLKDGKVIRYGYIRDGKLQKDNYISAYQRYINEYPDLKEKILQLQSQYNEMSKEVSQRDKELIKLGVEIQKLRVSVLDIVYRYVNNASIVITTMTKTVVDKLFEGAIYDAVFFDEVSMAYVPQIICAATMSKEKIVCVGDFMQLAPIARSEEKLNSNSEALVKDILSKDIFEFIGICNNGKAVYHPWLVMLDEQRRMHPKISEFPRKNVYVNLLKDHESVINGRKEIVSRKPFLNEPVSLIDLTGTYSATAKNSDNSRFNLLSAALAFSNALIAEKSGSKVSIITPFVAQTKIIKSLIDDYREDGHQTNIRCATVHQFQGSESDVVIFDAVESFPYKKPGWLMGKELPSILRLVNVAVTRARGKLIVLANKKFWDINYSSAQQSHLFYRLVNYITEEGNVVSHANQNLLENEISYLNKKGWIEYFTDEKYIDEFYSDLKSAKELVTFMLPKGEIERNILNNLYEILGDLIENHIAVKVIVSDKDEFPVEWENSIEENNDIVFPTVIIDEKTIWYGAPFAEWKFQIKKTGYYTICPIAFRVKGNRFIKMIDRMSKTKRNGQNNHKNKRKETKNSGLIRYASGLRKCPVCGKQMIFDRGKSGKFIFWCKDCKKTDFMTKEELQFYLQQNNIKCPAHNCEVRGGLSRYGLYVRCVMGHFLELDEV